MVPVAACKLLAHWLLTGLPLALIAPLLGYMLQLPVAGAGYPDGERVAGCAHAHRGSERHRRGATVGLNRGGIAGGVGVTALYVPVLVFGAGVVRTACGRPCHQVLLAVLGAILALAVSTSPVAVALGLRISAGD